MFQKKNMSVCRNYNDKVVFGASFVLYRTLEELAYSSDSFICSEPPKRAMPVDTMAFENIWGRQK
ncbi:hypothetical protein MAR_026764 [Mya arenaria]|uniref:Uncharacterized protein n=1 Tax=Mya arenaria TaxID=6604 RepID=A0ABY7EU04_MYAAR|nr:hypothetical protein MAR_026764 [Mya arenaria]